jgi:hypothetical protein
MIHPTREAAFEAAGRGLAVARAGRDALSPRAAAEAAWHPGHRLVTVEAIEALIIRQREEALAALRAKQAPPGTALTQPH